jgi:hypothetical protein
MKFRVVNVRELHLQDGKTFILTALDVGYHEFEPYESTLPSAARNTNGGGNGVPVRLTRPDGSTLETIATISLVSGIEPPAILSFSSISLADVPEGTEVEFLANATKAG